MRWWVGCGWYTVLNESCESIADKYNDFILDVAGLCDRLWSTQPGTGQHIPASWVQSFLCLAQAGIFRVSGTMHTPVHPLVTGFSNDSFAKLGAYHIHGESSSFLKITSFGFIFTKPAKSISHRELPKSTMRSGTRRMGQPDPSVPS